jgi:hypothetical protein
VPAWDAGSEVNDVAVHRYETPHCRFMPPPGAAQFASL